MIYLATPYNHEDPRIRHERFEMACFVAGQLMKEEVHVYSPIAHNHPIANLVDLPKGWDYWSVMDLHVIDRCEMVLVYEYSGWLESKGVSAEIAYAKMNNIPVRYLHPLSSYPVFPNISDTPRSHAV